MISVKDKMGRLHELRDKAKNENRDLTETEANEWDKLMLEVINEKEAQKEARSVFEKEDKEPKYLLAEIARSLKFGGEAKGISPEVRNLTSTTGASALQDPKLLDRVIFELQSSNELGAAGATFTRIENYSSVPKVTDYPSYQWQINEGDELAVDTNLTIGFKKWTLKDLAIRLRVSNQFLLDAGSRGQRIIEGSMRSQINQAIAQAVFTGSGTAGQPGGIETFTGIKTVDINPDAAITDWTEIIEAVRQLSAENVPISQLSAFFSPTGWAQLASFADTTGQPLRKPALLEPVTFYNPTTLVLETYDTNTTTKFFLGDFSRLVIGFQGLFSFTLDQTRASHLETEFIVHMRLDVQATHENHFAQITGILI